MRRTAIITTLLLLVFGWVFAQDWTYPVVIHSGDRAATRTLYLGVDYRGTDCFDSGLDVPLVPGVPGAYYCYLIPPCTEGFPAGMDPYLTTDIRSSNVDSVGYTATWVIRESGDTSPYDRLVSWVIEDLPLAEDTTDTSGKALAEVMQIGARPIGSTDTPAWVDMSTVDSFTFSPGYEVLINVVMVGGVDHLPPWVTNIYPSDSAEGISRTDSILFNIVDDVSGVDLSSVTVTATFHNSTLDSMADLTTLGVFTAIAGGGGYHFVYEHPGDAFPGTTQVCIFVTGQDNIGTVMDTFTWCFTTILEGEFDSFPPYFEQWIHAGMPLDVSIMDTVNFMDAISFNVRDAEFGVDITTLQVLVDDTDRTAEIETTRIGMYEEYNVVIPPFPSDGWTQGMPHSLEITVCDFAPNCTTITVDFYVPLPEDLVPWQFDVTINRGDVPSYLTFGMADDALTGFDSHDQIRLPMPGFYAYFPLDDPPGFLDLNEDYTVHIRVSDIDIVTHTLDTSYTFTTGGFCGPTFTMNITAYDSTADSLNFATVTIGTDSAATDGFDAGLDFPAPPPIGFDVVSINPDTTDTLFPEFSTE